MRVDDFLCLLGAIWGVKGGVWDGEKKSKKSKNFKNSKNVQNRYIWSFYDIVSKFKSFWAHFGQFWGVLIFDLISPRGAVTVINGF